jgi:hypothetical protein
MAEQPYRLVFDLAQAPSPWPGIALVFAIGLAAFAIAVALILWQRGRFGGGPKLDSRKTIWFFALFASVWAAVFLFGGFHQTARERALQAAARSGPVQIVEGCLDDFTPEEASSTRGTNSNERWSVAGRRFEYSSGDMGSAFHHIERGGGPVHADSRVRVSFVPDRFTGGLHIVRLEVKDRACRTAPTPAG